MEGALATVWAEKKWNLGDLGDSRWRCPCRGLFVFERSWEGGSRELGGGGIREVGFSG